MHEEVATSELCSVGSLPCSAVVTLELAVQGAEPAWSAEKCQSLTLSEHPVTALHYLAWCVVKAQHSKHMEFSVWKRLHAASVFFLKTLHLNEDSCGQDIVYLDP